MPMKDTQFTASTIVEAFNKADTISEDKMYLKTVIHDALAIFTTRYASSYPPRDMIHEVLELAKAQDEELYRSSISALSVVLAAGPLNNIEALQGLTFILRYPVTRYPLSNTEVSALLNLVLSRVTDNAMTLEALNKLLDAMADAEQPVSSYKEKEQIKKKLKTFDNNEEAAIKFQAGLALKNLEKIGIDETPREEWMRRAMAFGAAIESLCKIGSSVTSQVATLGVTSLFIVPEVITNARDAITAFGEAFNVHKKRSDWYSTVRSIQALLAAASVEDTNANVALTAKDLSPVFDQLKHKVSDIPRDIQCTLIDSLGKLLIVRSNEAVLDMALNVLLGYYEYSFHNSITHQSEKQAVRVKILEQLLILKQLKLEPAKEVLCDKYIQTIKKHDPKTYEACQTIAVSNVTSSMGKEVSQVGLLNTLVREAQQRVNRILDENKEAKEEIVIPLIGEGAVIKAPVNVKQTRTAIQLRGTVNAIKELFHDDIIRKILEKECEAASAVISKQIIGKNAQVEQRLDVEQKGEAPIVDLNPSEAQIPAVQRPITLTLSPEFKELIEDSLSNSKGYCFKVERENLNTLAITFVESKETLRQQGKRLDALQRALEAALKEKNLNYKAELNSDEKLIVTSDKVVIDAVVDLLCQQGLGKNFSAMKQWAYFWKGESMVSDNNRKEESMSVEQERSMNCVMQ